MAVTVIFDTDVFVWMQRGHRGAARVVEGEAERCLSVYTYMELLQGAKDKAQHIKISDLLREHDFRILELTEKIGHRAAVYVEEYALSGGLKAGDALIAATAVENAMVLCSGNHKHFKMLKELRLKTFEP